MTPTRTRRGRRPAARTRIPTAVPMAGAPAPSRLAWRWALGLGLGLCAWIGAGAASVAAAQPPAPDARAGEEFFETKVRPILAEHCQSCHGPNKEFSGLRLDSLERATKGGDLGPAVVPGNPGESLLVQAITHEGDLDLKMPPERPKLPDEAIGAIVEWIRMGAPWPEGRPTDDPESAARGHWAFRPIERPEVPVPPAPGAGASNPIDAFVEAGLREGGMEPAPPADKLALLRRAHFDLTGLPPTWDEVRAFLEDDSPDAFAKVVDELLASPHYGERWGRHWLDVARYADTKGYVFQEERRYPYSHTYRDYVIRAFNEDLPYDRFVMEQIAADRMDLGDDTRPMAAMGFLTIGRRFLNNQQDIIDDRIDVVTRGLMGLTVACARCHDHKYDPIPTEDYYSFYGVFDSSTEPSEPPILKGPGEPTPEGDEDYRKRIAEEEAKVAAFLDETRAAKVRDLRERVGEYWLAAFEIEFRADHAELDAAARRRELRPELLRFAARRWGEALNRESVPPALTVWARYRKLAADGWPAEPPAELERELAEAGAAWAEALIRPAPSSAAELAERHAALFKKALADRAEGGDAADPGTGGLREWLLAEGGPIEPGASFNERQFLDRADRNRLQELRRNVDRLKANHPGSPERAMALVDKPEPRDAPILIRGNPGRPGALAPRRFLKLIDGEAREPFRDGSGRLELARRIVSPDNPLTARVLVNRVWQHHFGAGLADSPSDFGTRSDPPSHPELLDWLAWTFMHEDGWSIKTLHRRIMLSETYQRSSDHPRASEYAELDPTNRRLWKFNRRRLDFEALRDATLAVAGRLDRTMGGKSVSIVDPPFATRRTVYAYIDRQNLEGLFRSFDFADPNISIGKRFVTTVPQQALFLMNSPFQMEQARALADSVASAGSGTPGDRVVELYRRLFGRDPSAEEFRLGVEFLTAGEARDREDAGASRESPWRFGYGAVEDTPDGGARTVEFHALPHRTKDRLQLAAEYPSGGNYLARTATGGHVGPDARTAAITRWVAPRRGLVTIVGTLKHPSDKGDGVRGRVITGRGAALGSWEVFNASVPTRARQVEVEAGETIDFVVDCRGEHSFDSYEWAPSVSYVNRSRGESWNVASDFGKSFEPPLPTAARYAQALLMTNEFAFVD